MFPVKLNISGRDYQRSHSGRQSSGQPSCIMHQVWKRQHASCTVCQPYQPGTNWRKVWSVTVSTRVSAQPTSWTLVIGGLCTNWRVCSTERYWPDPAALADSSQHVIFGNSRSCTWAFVYRMNLLQAISQQPAHIFAWSCSKLFTSSWALEHLTIFYFLVKF